MHKRLYILLCLCFSLILSGCYYSHPNKMDHWAANGEGAVDSVNFYINHHYWTGYNFRSTDTMSLQTAPPLAGLPDYGAIVNDTIAINSHDQLVVDLSREVYTSSMPRWLTKISVPPPAFFSSRVRYRSS